MKRFNRLSIAGLAIVSCLAIVGVGCLAAQSIEAAALTGGTLILGMGLALRDELLKGTRALPAAASATVDGAAIDLGHGSRGDFVASAEFKVTAPAVNTTMVPDTRTMTYSLIHSDNADLSSSTVLYPSLIVQTGAGAAGAATASATVRLPLDVKRYVGLRVVSGASTTDASTASATLEMLF